MRSNFAYRVVQHFLNHSYKCMFCLIIYTRTSKDRREPPLERKNTMSLSPSAVKILIIFFGNKYLHYYIYFVIFTYMTPFVQMNG